MISDEPSITVYCSFPKEVLENCLRLATDIKQPRIIYSTDPLANAEAAVNEMKVKAEQLEEILFRCLNPNETSFTERFFEQNGVG